jgi:hypothetical protein
LPARPPHFVASSSASLVSSDLNWSYLAPSVQSGKERRLVTGYGHLAATVDRCFSNLKSRNAAPPLT